MARWYLSRQRRCLDGGSIPSRARCNFVAFLTHHTLYGETIKSMDQDSNRKCGGVHPTSPLGAIPASPIPCALAARPEGVDVVL